MESRVSIGAIGLSGSHHRCPLQSAQQAAEALAPVAGRIVGWSAALAPAPDRWFEPAAASYIRLCVVPRGGDRPKGAADAERSSASRPPVQEYERASRRTPARPAGPPAARPNVI